MKERVVPSYYYTNLDTGKQCGNTRYKIIRFRKGNDDKDLSVNGVTPYFRILIQRV